MTAAAPLAELRAAAAIVHAVMPPTPQYRWPLLEAGFEARPGDVIKDTVKPEIHTPLALV